MHYIIKEKNRTPILVYDAPVDEKTLELRKRFDVDEKTGYPRMYNWRRLASLGTDYRPDEPFYKLGDNSPEQGYSTKVTILGLTTVVCGLAQTIATLSRGLPVYSRPQYVIAAWASANAILFWAHEKTLERQAIKNGVYVDYIRKHPERFETIHRPKMREVLFEYLPVR